MMKKSLSEIENKVYKIIASVGAIPPTEVIGSVPLRNFNYDSLDVFELTMHLKEEFGIDEIPNSLLSLDLTPIEITDYIYNELNKE